jgi:hypothetical protein
MANHGQMPCENDNIFFNLPIFIFLVCELGGNDDSQLQLCKHLHFWEENHY